jgi:uncharacterized protein YciI
MGNDTLPCYTVTGGGAVTRENDVATWIYVVHLTRFAATTSPTEEESAAIDRHFVRLQQACAEGTVRLAGPATDGAFGIVIFEAADETAARLFMAEDPAMLAGVMTAELHPFRISLEHLACP